MKNGRNPKAPRLVGFSFLASLEKHWPEYLMEAAALGFFMISAGVFTSLLDCPGSWGLETFPDEDLRRALIGLAMGGTATILIYCPWGKRSGAHMNPAVTLTFLRLGRIPPWDAFFYIVFQFIGGLAGVLVTALCLGSSFTDPPINYVVTVPGPLGEGAAFEGELVIAFIMMATILYTSNHERIARLTGIFAGVLITCYVFFESPLSGFGMNPARTVASALPSGIWTAMWIYFAAPLLGMLLAAEAYLFFKKRRPIHCCKLHHESPHHCIFCGKHHTPLFGIVSAVTSESDNRPGSAKV